MNKKYNTLLGILKGYGSAAVAFSGGIDSTFLLYAARDVLNDKLAAFTASSMVFPEKEKFFTIEIAKEMGVYHEIINIDLNSNLDFLKNDRQRCYYCKKNMLGVIKRHIDKMGFNFLLEGSNADDTNDYRPGMKAVEELGVKSPLKEVGFTKAEIIGLSKEYGFLNENKSPFSCLATRIAYGININQELLDKIEKLENYLNSIGLKKVRVRHHGDIARIETDQKDFKKIINKEVRTGILNKFYASGYKYVVLDLEVFLSGSMNK